MDTKVNTKLTWSDKGSAIGPDGTEYRLQSANEGEGTFHYAMYRAPGMESFEAVPYDDPFMDRTQAKATAQRFANGRAAAKT